MSTRTKTKILLLVMALGPVQTIASMAMAGKVWADEEESVVPIEEIAIQEEPVVPDGETEETSSYEADITASEGTLTYSVRDESGDLVEDELYPVWVQGEIISSEEIFTPEVEGDVELFLFSVEQNLEDIDYGSAVANDVYEVVFPVVDVAAFGDLTFRAGDRLVAQYVDEEVVDFAVLDTEMTVTPFESEWLIEGAVLETVGDYSFGVQVVNEEGFSSEVVDVAYSVTYGELSAIESELSVLVDGQSAEYVLAGEGSLQVEFTAKDKFRNGYEAENLERVDVRLNGEVMEGVDLVGDNEYQVVRSISVPARENMNSRVTVDIYSDDCEGKLLDVENYCFSKTYDFAIYDTNVESVSGLVYTKRTNEDSVTISGYKVPGYGVKVNSVSSEYVVVPNDSEVFSFEMPLAEGKNRIEIYAVKFVTEGLIFYSNPVNAIVEKDTKVSAPVWRDIPVTLDGDNQATLHWIDPIYLTNSDFDFSHVNIYRSTVPNFVPSEDNLVVRTHNPSWTDTGLSAGSKYYYLVESVDDLGNSNMIANVIATGDILGESAAISDYELYAQEVEALEQEYVGKGDGGDLNGEGESVQGEEESIVDESEDDEVGGFEKFWNNAKDTTSNLFQKITDNIFVQICCGGLLIFFGLMVLISVLVWLKEKIVDAARVRTNEARTEKKSSSKSKK